MRFLFFALLCWLISGNFTPVNAQNRQKTVSRPQLEYYLSHTLDAQLLSDMVLHPSFFYPGTADRIVNAQYMRGPTVPCAIDDRRRNDIRTGRSWARYQKILTAIGYLKPALLLDAVTLWGTWEMTEHLARSRHLVADLKAQNPDVVVMGSPNEYINAGIISDREIPQDVWDAFGLPNEHRPFDCYRMRDSMTAEMCANGFRPEIKHTETQLYYYWLSTTYIALGCEAISFSAISAIGSPDDYNAEWSGVVRRIRRYADTCPAVRFVLITAHSATGFYDTSGNLLFDFHIEPLRPTETPRDAVYPVGPNGGATVLAAQPACPTLYQNGRGGLNPNGWTCDRNPGLVFFDNYMDANRNSPGSAFSLWGKPHKARRRKPWVCWNPYYLDEISWFALQTAAYRDSFLRYAYRRVHELDRHLYLALPFKRAVAAGTDAYAEYTCDGGEHYQNKDWWPAEYFAIDPDGDLFPEPPRVGNYFFAPPDRARLPLFGGYGQETVMREILSHRSK